jgi:hypothetical protein
MNKRRYIFLLTLLGILFAPLSLWSQDSTIVWKRQTIANGISAEMPGYSSGVSLGDISTTMCNYRDGNFLLTEMPPFPLGNDAPKAIEAWVESEFSNNGRIKTSIKQLRKSCGFETVQIVTENIADSGEVSQKMEMILICADQKFYHLAFMAPPAIFDQLAVERTRFFNSLECVMHDPKAQPAKGNQLILWIGLPVLVIAWLILRKRFSRSQEE